MHQSSETVVAASQEVVDQLAKQGIKATLITPDQMVKMMADQLMRAESMMRVMLSSWRKEKLRFWISVACNVVLLALIWWKF